MHPSRNLIILLGGLLSGAPAHAIDKSGVGPNAISLPGGPGSIEGLGESFQPNPNSGTPSYAIGITVPPGTAGHTPALALRYDGGAPNGIMGFGWSLGVPYVQRQTEKGIPRYVDADNSVDDDGDGTIDEVDERDRFLTEGAEELVPLANGDHFAKNEGAFLRYRRVGAHWEAHRPDGTRLRFGVNASARIEDSGRVFKWLLEEEIDPRGNTISYHYASAAGAQNLNQKYLSKVEYGPGAAPRVNFHFVAFTYQARPDGFEDCRSGYPVRTGQRLSQVTVGTQGPSLVGHLSGDFNSDSLVDNLVRRYEIEYLQYAGPNTHWSFVSRVRHVGADGVSELPATTFGYAVCEPPEVVDASAAVIGAFNEPPRAPDFDSVDLLDINGDGLPDLLETPGFGGVHLAYLNQGEVFTNGAWRLRWDPGVDMNSLDGLAWNFDLQSISGNLSALADMDGDGTADFCYYRTANDTVAYFRNLGTNLAWGVDTPMSTQDFVPPSPLGVPNVTMGDFDHDKRSDIIRTVDEFTYHVWFNLGGNAYTRRFTELQNDGFMLAMSGVDLADFNGDRMPDFTRIFEDKVEVATGLGHGRFADRVSVFLPDFNLDAQQLERARMRDLNGDGLSDLVVERVAPGELWYWLNLGNYSFSTRKRITGLPEVGTDTQTRWADMNGNGTVDLMYADTSGSPRMQSVDLGRLIGCHDGMNMLKAVDNGIGLVTRYTYRSSVEFALDDRRAGQAWPDLMPFAMNVVSEVIEDDTLGGVYRTQYAYHQGFYEETEKEFRGFAFVEEVEVGDVTAPSLVTRTFYDQGKTHEALQGVPLRVQVEEESGARFEETITGWSQPPRVLHTGINGVNVVFAHPVAVTNIVTEKGQGTPRMTETEMDFDNFGNEIARREWGVVEPGNKSAFNDERFTLAEYAFNEAAWIVNAVARERITDEHGVVHAKEETYYDDPTFAGSNFGAVTRGEPTLVRRWHTPADANGYVRAERTVYDAFGNAVTKLDPLSADTPNPAAGHHREVAYDAAFRTHPVQETIHVGGGSEPIVFSAVYHPAFGVASTSVDANGHTTTFTYDVFGRLISTAKPGDTPGYPSARYEYHEAVPFGTGHVNFVETQLLDRTPASAGALRNHYFISRAFTDGLQRPRLVKFEAGPHEVSGQPQYGVREAVRFNARKSVHTTLNTYYSLAADGFGFERVEAVGWQGRFHEEGALITRNLASAPQTALTYDAQGRTIRLDTPDGARAETVYEPLVTRSFDDHDLNPASPHYLTPTVSHTDGLGRVFRTDQVVKIEDDGSPAATPRTWTTFFAHDLNDLRTQITDPQGNICQFTYDGLKRQVLRQDPNQGSVSLVYDAAGNVLQTTDNSGQTVVYTYDGANRKLSEDFLDAGRPFAHGRVYNPAQPLNPPVEQAHRLFNGTVVGPVNFPDVLYQYDASIPNLDLGDNTTATAQNLNGRLAVVVDLSGMELNGYNARSQVDYQVKRVADPATGDLVSYTSRFTFDAMDRPVTVVYPDNDSTTLEYNDRNEISRLRGDRVGDLLHTPVYTPDGTLQSYRLGNGVETLHAFDRRGRPFSQITRRVAAPAQPLTSQRYVFDAVSNLAAIDDLRSHIASTDPRHDSRTFTYDNRYRLTGYQLTNPAHTSNRGSLAYRHDRIGNLLFSSSPALGQPGHLQHDEHGRTLVNVGTRTFGGSAGRFNRTVRLPGQQPGPGALTSTADGRSLAYDNNGNVISREDDTLYWDFLDRLVAVSNSTRLVTFRYDFQNHRVIRHTRMADASQLPSTTVYVNPGFEVRPDGQAVKFAQAEKMRVAKIIGSFSSVPNRLQRFAVHDGWNHLSLAISAPNAAAQLGIGSNPSLEACFRALPGGGYTAVGAGDALPAGAVFWIKATAPQVLEVVGTYADPSATTVNPGGALLPAPGLESAPLAGSLPAQAEIHVWDAVLKRWRAEWPTAPVSLGLDTPAHLAPGTVGFVRVPTSTTFSPAPAATRVRYYHADHQGSLLAVTDAAGDLLEELAYYPYGQVRHRHAPGSTREDYQYTGKERDLDTGLVYFGARYYDATLGVWLSVDPLVDMYPDLSPYVFVGGNPITRVDPDGRFFKAIAKAIGKLFSGAGRRQDPQQRGARGGRSSEDRPKLKRSNASRSLTGNSRPGGGGRHYDRIQLRPPSGQLGSRGSFRAAGSVGRGGGENIYSNVGLRMSGGGGNPYDGVQAPLRPGGGGNPYDAVNSSFRGGGGNIYEGVNAPLTLGGGGRGGLASVRASFQLPAAGVYDSVPGGEYGRVPGGSLRAGTLRNSRVYDQVELLPLGGGGSRPSLRRTDSDMDIDPP
jgi:RHS repeat-associated protein